MNYNAILLLLGCFLSMGASAVVTSYNQYAHDARSALFGIYSSNTAMTQSTNLQYDVNFDSAMTNIPDLVFGLCEYKQSGELTVVFQMSQLTLNLVKFVLQVYTSGASIYKIKVSYLAFRDQSSNFYPLTVTYDSTALGLLVSGMGDRNVQISKSFFSLTGGSQLNTQLSKNICYLYFVGFNTFGSSAISITADVIIESSVTFKTRIYAKLNQVVFQVTLKYIFINLQPFLDNTLYVIQHSIIKCTHDNNVNEELKYISTDGNYILGVSSLVMQSLDITDFIRFDLAIAFTSEVFAVNYGLDDQADFVSIDFGYIFIAEIYCPAESPYFVDSAKEYCTDKCEINQTQTPSNSVCEDCVSPCVQCSTSPTYCTSCIPDFLLSIDDGTCSENVTVQQNQTSVDPEPVDPPQPVDPTPTPSPPQPVDPEPTAKGDYSLLGLLALIPLILIST